MLADVLFFLLVVIMGLMDFLPTLAYLIQSLVSKAVAKVTRSKLAKRNAIDLIYTLSWILVGLLALIAVKPPSLFTLFVFLAFKSGSDLGSRIVYSVHDLKLLRRIKVIAISLLLAAIPSMFFIIIWRTFNQILLNVSASLLRVTVSDLSLKLWLSGLIYGLLLGTIRSKGEEGILLRGELMLVLGGALLKAGDLVGAYVQGKGDRGS